MSSREEILFLRRFSMESKEGVCSFCQSVIGLDGSGLVVDHLVGGVGGGAPRCEGVGSEPECVVGSKVVMVPCSVCGVLMGVDVGDVGEACACSEACAKRL